MLLSYFKGSHSETLKCEFVQHSLYTCEAYDLGNDNPNSVINGYTGPHLDSKATADVKALTIDDNNTFYIPENLGQLFDLTKFSLQRTQVFEIKAKHFLGMENLEYLSLAGNKLTTLTSDVFSALTKLTCINLSSNKIRFIGDATFDKLVNLRHVTLVNNGCGNKVYNESSGIVRLKSDVRSFCFIKRVRVPRPRKLSPLEEQRKHLTKEISKLEQQLVVLKGQLAGLTMNVQKLECEFTTDAASLYSCSVSRLVNEDRSMTIDGYNGKHLENYKDDNVKSIYINNATMKYLPAKLGHLFSLTSLIVNKTQLMEIQSGDFDRMQDLRTLTISSCRLTGIPVDAFSTLPKLTFVDFNKNLIEVIPNGVFQHNPMIKELHLFNNNIKYLNANVFNGLPELDYVDMEHNPCLGTYFSGDEEIAQLKKDVLNCKNPNE